MELKICHLYPDILNLYGDRGQYPLHGAAALRWRDIAVTTTNISIGHAAEGRGLRPVFHRRRPGF